MLITVLLLLRYLKFAQISAPHRFSEERISLNLLNTDTLQPFSCQAKNAHPHVLNIISCPQSTHLQWREVMIDKEREPTNRNYQELHPEGVMVSIIGGLELHVDQVHGGVRASDVDKLRARKGKTPNNPQRFQD